MPHINFEFKAKTNRLNELEEKLKSLHPVFKGEDRQTDTYFNVANGRLKLREGNVENALIYYERENTHSAKQSNVMLYQHIPAAGLKEILSKVHGIKAVVTKRRKIYFVNHVKIHFDKVNELGTFVEVEAIDTNGNMNLEDLKQQCDFFADLFDIQPDDYMAHSYSDMMLQ
jgi:predicted adenylyl cyclase CyaB